MNDDVLARLGARVRRIRQANGSTQQDLAERAGLHITYIARVEAGKRNPSLKSLTLLAKGLDVTLAGLLEGIDA